MFTRLVFSLSTNIDLSMHFTGIKQKNLTQFLMESIQQILHDIIDMIPLNPERIQYIRTLSDEEKMRIILTFNHIVQRLVEMITEDSI